MTKSAQLDFAIQRNEDFGPFVFALLDTDAKAINVQGWVFTLAVDVGAGRSGVPPLKVTQFANPAGSYIQVHDEAAGELELFVARSEVMALAGPDDRFVSLVHNLIASDESGYERVVARGHFIAEPGV